jgi:hypothetical protein
MDKKSRYLLVAVIFLALTSASISVYRNYYTHNYYIEAEVPCDPTTTECKVIECDSEEPECLNGVTYVQLLTFLPVDNLSCNILETECQDEICSNSQAECSYSIDY